MSGIQLEQVSFRYDNGFVAVENVNMDIKKGEKVAIVGQNGAGKTTTVKLMNGLLRPFTGRVLVDGEDIATKTTATVSRKVGYVFQNPGDQIFNKDVYSEIAYSPKYMKLDNTEVDRRVQESAELCGIKKYLKINPYELPFSLRKFVTIASVIAMGCEYIILDEPTAGQDLEGLQLQKRIIDELIAQGKTVVTITHDMEFVLNHFCRVIVMANKKVVGDGNAKEIFWDLDILKQADLKQPNILQLADYLGIQGITNVSELIGALE